jgi:hypothetical protein
MCGVQRIAIEQNSKQFGFIFGFGQQVDYNS